MSDFEDMSDEELSLLIYSPRPRVIRERPNHFDVWRDAEFYARFRMSKNTAQRVLNQIAPIIANKTNWNHSLSVETMFLMTLRFFASGGMLISSGDFCGVSKSTISKVVKKVSLALCMLREQYLKFPLNSDEINNTVLGFYRLARFPNVIAALDCTHVKIQSPGGQTGEIFRNRKGFFSMNVQALCDANLNILDVVARWPGSCHDSTIFRNSRICARFESGEFGDKILVADGGYPSKPYIMTPIRNCLNPLQQRYNKAQISTRNPIERAFGVWKRRFPILAMGLRLKISTVQMVVVATAILHNICCKEKESDPPPLDADIEEQVRLSLTVSAENLNLANELGARREAMVEYFSHISNTSTH